MQMRRPAPVGIRLPDPGDLLPLFNRQADLKPIQRIRTQMAVKGIKAISPSVWMLQNYGGAVVERRRIIFDAVNFAVKGA